MPRPLQLVVERPARVSPSSSAIHSATVSNGISATRFRVVEVPTRQKETGLPATWRWRNVSMLIAAHAAMASLLAMVSRSALQSICTVRLCDAFQCSQAADVAICCHSDQVALIRTMTLPLAAEPLLPLALSLASLLLSIGFLAVCQRRTGAASQGELLREESLLLIPGVGVQMEVGQARSHSSVHGESAAEPECVWRRSRRFVDAAHLRAALINEGVQGSQYRFYLLLLTAADGVHGKDAETSSSAQTIVLPFEQLQPRYRLLLPIREGLQSMLQHSRGAVEQ